jgi:hypothetical protein
MHYSPDKKYPVSETHPLNNLIKSDEHGKNIKNSLRYLPYKDLKLLSNAIYDNIDQKKEKPDNSAEPLK